MRKVRVLFKTRLIFPGINGPNIFIQENTLYSVGIGGNPVSLKGNCRVGHHFSGKPCKCFPYCDTTKKYILSDPFGSEIAIESVHFAAHSIFRH